MQQPTYRLRVTNIPLHVRKEEFAGLFRPMEGCLECRLVNEADRPVGYATFAAEHLAAQAQEAYNKWQGFGSGGLLVDLIATEPRHDVHAAVAHPQYRTPLKRPPPEMIEPPMHGGGYKQVRRAAPGQMEFAGQPQPEGRWEGQLPPQEQRFPPRYAPEAEPAAPYSGGRLNPRTDPQVPPPAAQYDDYVPPGGYSAAPGGRFPGGEPPAARYAPADAGPGPSTRYPPEQQPGYREPAPARYQQPDSYPAAASARRPADAGPPGRDYGPPYDAGFPLERQLLRQPAPAYDDAYDRGVPPLQQGPAGGAGPAEPYGAGGAPSQFYGGGGGGSGSGAAPAPHLTEEQLGPDARPSLYVEQLPAGVSMREVAHIFRPFQGYKEVRLVERQSKVTPGEVITIAFVDFTDTLSATEAMRALQSYPMDPVEETTQTLRIKYATERGTHRGWRGGPGRFEDGPPRGPPHGGRGYDAGPPRGGGGGRGYDGPRGGGGGRSGAPFVASNHRLPEREGARGAAVGPGPGDRSRPPISGGGIDRLRQGGGGGRHGSAGGGERGHRASRGPAK